MWVSTTYCGTTCGAGLHHVKISKPHPLAFLMRTCSSASLKTLNNKKSMKNSSLILGKKPPFNLRHLAVPIGFALLALGQWAQAQLTSWPADINGNTVTPTAGDYRSVATGRWTNNATWQTYSSGSWVAASSSPTTGHRTDITNFTTVTMTNASSLTINEIVVDSGGTLNFANKTTAVTLSVGDGIHPDLDIYGTVNLTTSSGLVFSGNPSIFVESGAALNANDKTSLLISSGAPLIVVNGGVVAGSGEIIVSGGSPVITITNMGQFRCTNSTALYLGGSGSPTITIGGNGSGTLTAWGAKSALVLAGGSPSITVNNGGALNANGATGIAVTGGTPSITVNTGGSLNISAATGLDVTGGTVTITITNRATFINAVSGGKNAIVATSPGAVNLTNQSGATYLVTSGGIVDTAIWQDGSTLLVTNAGALAGGIGQNFYDFIWNSPAQAASADAAGGNITVRHNLIIANANAQVLKNIPAFGNTANIGGDLLITNVTFNLQGSAGAGAILNLTNNFAIAANATLDVTGSPSTVPQINFVGGGSHTLFQGGTINNATRYAWTVASGDTLTLSGGNIIINAGATTSSVTNNGTLILGANEITGTGAFAAGAGSTTKLGAAVGITANTPANIWLTSGNSIVSDPTANFEFNGSVAQLTGTNFPAAISNLTVNNSASLQANTSITLNGTLALTSGIFDLGGNNLGAAQLSSSGTVTNSTGSGTLTYGGAGNSLNFGGMLTDGGGGGGTLGLTKAGSGTLTLTASNPYHGSTIISNGTLVLSGSGAIGSSTNISVAGATATFDVSGVSGGFTLRGGQTLSGIGVVTGAVTTASGAAIAPGNSPGTLTFTNNLTLSSGETTYFELTNAPGPSDEVVVGGTLTAASSTIDITVLGSMLNPGTYTLFHYGGSLSGTFNSTVAVHGVVNGIGALTYDSVNKNVNYAVTGQSVDALTFTTEPTDTMAGQHVSPAVVVRATLSGSPVAGVYVTLSLTNSSGTLSGMPIQQTDSSGNATFGDLSINLAGIKILQAIGANLTNDSTAFKITNGAAAQLFIVQQPSITTTAGVAFVQQPIVQVVDQFGNTVSNSTATITARASSGTLLGTTNVSADGVHGTATYTSLAATAAGTLHLIFSSTGLNPTNSVNITNSAAATTQLLITPAIASPQFSTAPFAPSPVITVADQYGNATPSNAVVDAVLSSTTGSGTLGGTAEVTATSGIATFSNLKFTLGGSASENIVVYFTSTGLTSATNALVTVNPIPIYRSVASGNWNDTNAWQSSLDNGATWTTPATLVPAGGNNLGVMITNGVTVTITNSMTQDYVTVNAGGQIIVSNTLTIAHGTTTDLDVFGTVNVGTGGTVTNNTGAVIVFESGSTYLHNQNGSTVPSATWADGSTCQITGMTSTSPTLNHQSFYNFIWNCTSQSGSGGFAGNDFSEARGNFTVLSSGSSIFKFAPASSQIISIGGNFTVTGNSTVNILSSTSSTGSQYLLRWKLHGGYRMHADQQRWHGHHVEFHQQQRGADVHQ